MLVIGIPGVVKTEVTNDSLQVELAGQPIDVHVDDDPLPVTIELLKRIKDVESRSGKSFERFVGGFFLAGLAAAPGAWFT